LFGLNFLRESLFKLNNLKLQKIIKSATSTKFKAFLIGIFTTVLIQSSSGVTAIVIAFICAKLLDFKSGVMIMIGSNIGTTVTAFLFTFEIEKYGLIFIIIAGMLLFSKKKKIINISEIISGFGILFLGLDFMNQGFYELSKSEYFLNFSVELSKNRITAFSAGTLIAFLLQSSSVTISLSQSLYHLSQVSLNSAIAIMLGANLGTAIASIIPAVSSTKEAKAAVYINIIFNLFGGILFIILLDPFSEFLKLIESGFLNKKMTIAYSHLIYNTITAIIFYFFVDFFISRTIKLHNFKVDYNT
jgi:phosphate:Na+ symporter